MGEREGELQEVSGNVTFNDALTGFLYELMRDHMPTGKVEELVRRAVSSSDAVFTNGWLAKYANNLAEELTNAKTNNLAKVLSEAFGDSPNRNAVDARPSFKSDEEVAGERAEDSRKVIDTLVQSGQLNPEEAEEIKREIEEFEKESLEQANAPTAYVGGGEPTKDGESVVVTNDNPNLTFNKTEE